MVVRNWSGHEGIADLLQKAGVIEGAPVDHARSGFVSAQVYKLSARAMAAVPAR